MLPWRRRRSETFRRTLTSFGPFSHCLLSPWLKSALGLSRLWSPSSILFLSGHAPHQSMRKAQSIWSRPTHSQNRAGTIKTFWGLGHRQQRSLLVEIWDGSGGLATQRRWTSLNGEPWTLSWDAFHNKSARARELVEEKPRWNWNESDFGIWVSDSLRCVQTWGVKKPGTLDRPNLGTHMRELSICLALPRYFGPANMKCLIIIGLFKSILSTHKEFLCYGRKIWYLFRAILRTYASKIMCSLDVHCEREAFFSW